MKELRYVVTLSVAKKKSISEDKLATLIFLVSNGLLFK